MDDAELDAFGNAVPPDGEALMLLALPSSS